MAGELESQGSVIARQRPILGPRGNHSEARLTRATDAFKHDHPGRAGRGRLRLVIPLLLAMTGCSVNVAVPPTALPDALVEPYPLRAGLRYTDSINAFRHEETLPSGEDWTIDLGRSSRVMLASVANDLFTSVVELEKQDPVPDALDLLMEAEVEAFEFALPAQTVNEDYTVWIRYRIRVYDADGNEQANWPISAYGKASDDAIMSGRRTALQQAAGLAIRDAAVLLLTRFGKDAQLAGNQLAGEEAVEPPAIEPPADLPPGATPPGSTSGPRDGSEQERLVYD